VPAGVFEQADAFRFIALCSAIEQLVDLLPAFRGQGRCPELHLVYHSLERARLKCL
jgi:hypothetical protein